MAGRQIAESKLQPNLQFVIVIYISKEITLPALAHLIWAKFMKPCSVDMLPWRTGNLQERNKQRKEIT